MKSAENGQLQYERVGSRDLKITYEEGDDRRETLVRVFPSSKEDSKQAVSAPPPARAHMGNGTSDSRRSRSPDR